MKPISTVNVIIKKDNIIESIVSFYDNPEGNKAAEESFEVTIRKEYPISDKDMKIAIEDGYFDIGGHQFFLIHSESAEWIIKK